MNELIAKARKLGLSADDLVIEAESLEECGEYLHGALMGYSSDELREASKLLAGEQKSFRVWAKMTSYAYLDVKANSKEEAEKIAEDTDGGEFISTNEGDWEIMTDSTSEVV